MKPNNTTTGDRQRRANPSLKAPLLCRGRFRRLKSAPPSYSPNLRGIVRDYLDFALIVLYFASDTNALAPISLFGFPELLSIATPNQDRKDLIWIRLI
jgi:hypothetical protein